MTTAINRKLTRRGLLKGAAIGAAATFLAACQPKVVEVTRVVEKEVEKVVKETVVVAGTPQVVEKVVKETVEVKVAPAGPVEVKVIVAPWVDAAWSISQRANAYNDGKENLRVTIIPIPDGWDAKAMAQIAEGTLAWDGNLTNHPFRFAVQWIAQGMMQTVDEYLDVNPLMDMNSFWSDTISPELIKYDCSIKEKVVGVPVGIDTCCQGFRADMMSELGLPATREDYMKERSWAAITEWAIKIREKYKGDNVWGIANHNVFHQSLGQIFQSITTDLYYEDEGLIKFDSEAMQEALRIQSNWCWTGAGKVPLWPTTTFIEGKAGLWAGQVGTVGGAQRAWGKDRVPNACPAHNEGGTGGNQWYTTCGFIFNKAKHPQETINFYLDMFGPQNDLNAQKCLEYNWFPIFKSQWDKQVEGKPAYSWAKDFIPQFLNCKLIPRNPYYEIEWPLAQKYGELLQAQKIEVKEAADTIMKEVRDGVSKLKLDW